MGYSDYSNDIKATSTTASQATPGTAVSSSSTATPKTGVIPVGKSDKPEEIIAKLINSNEFRNLSNQDKLAELQKYFPSVNETELKTILDNINAKIATTEPDSKNNAAGVNTDALISNIVKKAKELKLDIKLEDFEKLKNILTSLMTGGNINSKEFFNAIKPFAKILDNIIPSLDNWNDLSSKEKLNARFEALITFFMPEYQNMDDEKKSGIRDKAFTKIASIMFPEINNVSNTTKDIAISTLANIIDMSEKEGLSLEKILNDPKSATAKVAGDIIDKWTKSDKNIDFSSDEWKNLDNSEQLTIIIKDLVQELAPEIAPENLEKLSFEEITKILNPIGEKLFGKEEWTKHPENCITNLTTKLAAMKNWNQENSDSPKSFADFASDQLLSLDAVEAYEKAVDTKLTPYQMVQREAYREKLENSKLEPGQKVSQPSIVEMRAHIEEKLKNPNLSKEERERYKKEYKRLFRHEQRILKNDKLSDKEKQELLNEPMPEVESTGAYILSTKFKTEKGYDFKGYINDYCKNLGINPKELSFQQKAEILNQLRDPSLAMALGKELGLASRTVIKLLDDKNLINDTAHLDELEQYNVAILMPHHDSKMARAFGRDTVIDNAKEIGISAEQLAKDTESWYTKDNPYAKENAEETPILLNKYELEKEYISEYTTNNLNNENIETEIKGTLVDSTIKNAPDDDTKVYYGKEFSQNTKDPDVLEYIGASSKYVEDPGKRSQYNTYVTEAAKNYPPETQVKIQRAIETGKVSTGSSAAPSSPAASRPATQTTKQNEPRLNPTIVPTPTVSTTSVTTHVAPTKPSDAQNTPTPIATNIDTINRQTTQALQQKKESALDNIEGLQEHIAVEQAAREITNEAIEEFVNAIEEIETTEDPSKINEAKIKQFINSSSLNVIYSKLIERFGSSVIRKLISAVASYGNSSKIDTLATIIKDRNLLEELFIKCQNKRLLDKLQSSTVKKFIPMMNDLSIVRSDIMYEFIMDLINSNAGIDEIKKYLRYLPFGMQANICETYNNLKGVQLDSKFALKPNRKNQKEKPQDTDTDTKAQAQKSQKEQKEEPKIQPVIKPNELTAVRNDGVTIKHKDTFAGISDQYEEDAYEVVDNETGKTQSQRETILTPGSYEWNIKYNKQAPATAFTMAALEEDNEDGIGVFGSTKVGMKQPIKKKYKPQDFKFNA